MIRLKAKQLLHLNSIFNIFLILTYFSFINSVIEIPLTPYRVKGVSKYKDFKIEGPVENLDENELKMKLFTEEGDIFVHTNLLFMANVKVGSNQQNFNLCLDTGSFITWLPIKNSRDAFPLQNHFDPNASNTCRKTKDQFQQEYLDGSLVGGYYYYDNFYYINNRNFQVLFGLSEQTNFMGGGDGIIGLGQYYDNRELSFIHMLNKGGVTTSRIFSLKFENTFNFQITGKLFIGQHQDFSQNNVATCPLERVDGRKDFWVCKVKSLTVKSSAGTFQSYKSYNVIFDTGTNAILLPMQYIEDIGNNLFQVNKCNVITEDNTLYRLVCTNINNLPDFKFEINNHAFIMPREYIFAQLGDSFISSVYFIMNFDHIIMGSAFFFMFHTLFNEDAGQLHFYPMDPQFLVKLY
jgi:hypothetical protein